MSCSLNVKSFGITHLGLARDNNEDAFAFCEERHFFALADGMGGHAAGEVAADLSLKSLCTSYTEKSSALSLQENCLFLREAIAKANQLIFGQATLHSHYKGMGTTLSCFTLTDNHLIYGHVGDSRLYRYRQELSLLTQDHCFKMRKKAPHLITRAVGTHPYLLPDIGVIPIHSNDLYMLCSDGLSDYVDLNQMQAILHSPLDLDEKGKTLLKAALEKGGRDNITLFLIHIE